MLLSFRLSSGLRLLSDNDSAKKLVSSTLASNVAADEDFDDDEDDADADVDDEDEEETETAVREMLTNDYLEGQ